MMVQVHPCSNVVSQLVSPACPIQGVQTLPATQLWLARRSPTPGTYKVAGSSLGDYGCWLFAKTADLRSPRQDTHQVAGEKVHCHDKATQTQNVCASTPLRDVWSGHTDAAALALILCSMPGGQIADLVLALYALYYRPTKQYQHQLLRQAVMPSTFGHV